jgi:hypothetical protein
MLDRSFQEGTRAHQIPCFLIENHQVVRKRSPSVRIFNSTSLSPALKLFFLYHHTSGKIRLSKFNFSRSFASLHYLWSIEVFNICSEMLTEVHGRNFYFMWGKFVILSRQGFRLKDAPPLDFPGSLGTRARPDVEWSWFESFKISRYWKRYYLTARRATVAMRSILPREMPAKVCGVLRLVLFTSVDLRLPSASIKPYYHRPVHMIILRNIPSYNYTRVHMNWAFSPGLHHHGGAYLSEAWVE